MNNIWLTIGGLTIALFFHVLHIFSSNLVIWQKRVYIQKDYDDIFSCKMIKKGNIIFIIWEIFYIFFISSTGLQTLPHRGHSATNE